MIRLGAAIFAILLSAYAAPAAAAQQAGNGRWELRAPGVVGGVSYSLSNVLSAAAGGRIYVIRQDGGGSGWAGGYVLLVYDLTTDSWSFRTGLPALPTGYRTIGYQCAALAGGIYCFDGTIWDATGATFDYGATHRYDVPTDSWSRAADLPDDVTCTAAAASPYRVWLVGAGRTPPYARTVYEFDPAGAGGLGTFIGVSPSPLGLYDYRAGMAVVDGRIYLMRLTGPYGVYARAAFEFDPADPGAGWTAKAPPPEEMAGPVGECNGRLYVFADLVSGTGPAAQRFIYEYRPPTDSWVRRAGMPDYPATQFYSGVQGHGAVSISIDGVPRVHCMGGINGVSQNRNRVFFPPDYGAAPGAPAELAMARTDGSPIAAGGWTNETGILISAFVDDPDVDEVCLEVEVVPTTADFENRPTATGALAPEGRVSVRFDGLTPGAWKWQARARDWNDNVSPWVPFEAVNDVDFQVDRTAPPFTRGVAPSGERVRIWSRFAGPVTFEWEEVAGDSESPLGYEIQVALDSAFTRIEASTWLQGPASRITLNLRPLMEDAPYYWRIRSLDAAGNSAPAWSSTLWFKVYFDDGIDHGAGDAQRVCGFGSGGNAAPALWGLALVALAVRLRWR